MLNQKFASIRANSKTDKRNSVTHHDNQRLSQSQSMEMPANYQQSQKINNNILMNLTKTASARSSYSRPDFDSGSVEIPTRSPVPKTFAQHPYVNLMHPQQHQSYNDIARYQLQYQNSNVSIGSQSTPDAMHQSWNLQSPTQQVPLTTHFTAAQIYMRPKVNVSPYSSTYSTASKKPPPPEVPKRLSSTISMGSNSSLKKSNELSRSSRKLNNCSTSSAF